MYEMYFGDVRIPVTPEKIQTKINNKNKTYTLLSSREMSILKDPGLTDVSFDLLLPNEKYPFAVYPNGFKNAKYYLDILENYKQNKSIFRYILSRSVRKKDIMHTSMLCSLEDYTITEDAKYWTDVMVSVKLKQYIPQSTKAVALPAEMDTAGVALQTTTQRADTTGNSPIAAGNTPNPYKVVEGDSLFNICKKYLGDGNRCWEIAKYNGYSNPNVIAIGDSIYFPGT